MDIRLQSRNWVYIKMTLVKNVLKKTRSILTLGPKNVKLVSELFFRLKATIFFWPGSLARSCNFATNRLVYQDVRGLSATEPWLGSDLGPH